MLVSALAWVAFGTLQAKPGGVIDRYIQPEFLTEAPFGTRSHWLQPWRAYLETVPTARLREAIGINLNVEPEEAEAVCAHLEEHGFTKVRIEFGWNSIAWNGGLADPNKFETIVGAAAKHHLRPLFLLNANQGAPCPMRTVAAKLAKDAPQGALRISLDPATASLIKPGYTGFTNLNGYKAADPLIVHIDPDGSALLSRALPKPLPAGEIRLVELKYLPFYPSKLKSSGAEPAEFRQTMDGWLQYVGTIAHEARRVLGTWGQDDAGFDLEVWNELTFGSEFLSINNYYGSPVAEGDWAPDAIVRETVAYVNGPKNELPGVGIGNGFENQRPWASGANSPPGLTAIDKHPYAGVKRFPQDAGLPNAIVPLDALGKRSGKELAPGRWVDRFIPKYISHFPEYFLSEIQTETLIRDLSPIQTDVYGLPHGRTTHPKNAPPPAMWITEVNFDGRGAEFELPGGPGVGVLSPAEADHIKAKALLRYLTSFVNKGVDRIYFYAAKDKDPQGLGLILPEFFEAIKNKGQVDAPGLVSESMGVVERLAGNLPVGDITGARSVRLDKIADSHGHVQFEGDPSSANMKPNPRPPLYNRDVLGFFPFQSSDRGFVIAMYVMTRNLCHQYNASPFTSDPAKFDMPEETYELTLSGLHAKTLFLDLYDVMADTHSPVQVTWRSDTRLTVSVPLTDAPRLLIVREIAEQLSKSTESPKQPPTQPTDAGR